MYFLVSPCWYMNCKATSNFKGLSCLPNRCWKQNITKNFFPWTPCLFKMLNVSSSRHGSRIQVYYSLSYWLPIVFLLYKHIKNTWRLRQGCKNVWHMKGNLRASSEAQLIINVSYFSYCKKGNQCLFLPQHLFSSL